MDDKKDKLAISEYSMFAPVSQRALTTDYPELKKYREINDLRKAEQFFCWYLGCQVSPLYEAYTDPKSREKAVKKAYEMSFERLSSNMSKGDYSIVFEDNKMPAHLKRAIEKFETFQISARIRARKVVDKVSENMQKIIDVDVNGEEFYVIDKDGQTTTEIDWGKKKQYTEMALKIASELPKIQAQAEQGFGVIDKSESVDIDFKEEGSFLDMYHDEED